VQRFPVADAAGAEHCGYGTRDLQQLPGRDKPKSNLWFMNPESDFSARFIVTSKSRQLCASVGTVDEDAMRRNIENPR
jgi:hypothetical protein